MHRLLRNQLQRESWLVQLQRRLQLELQRHLRELLFEQRKRNAMHRRMPSELQRNVLRAMHRNATVRRLHGAVQRIVRWFMHRSSERGLQRELPRQLCR